MDADGHFKVRATLKKGGSGDLSTMVSDKALGGKKERFGATVHIEQRIVGKLGGSYEPVMQQMAD